MEAVLDSFHDQLAEDGALGNGAGHDLIDATRLDEVNPPIYDIAGRWLRSARERPAELRRDRLRLLGPSTGAESGSAAYGVRHAHR